MASQVSLSNHGSGDGTVTRVLRLLDCFTEAEEWSLTALSQRLGLPPSTVHRLLNLCRNEGFVASAGRGSYRPGLALYRLAGGLTHHFSLGRFAQPLLDRLAEEFNETALLVVLDRPTLTMYFAGMAEPSASVRYVIEKHQLAPLTWGGTGRSILAYMAERDIETVLARGDECPVDGRHFVPAELRVELADIRKKGFAYSCGQRIPESVATAVPFFDAAGAVVGSLAVTIPSFRYKDETGEHVRLRLQDMAADVSYTLGFNDNAHSRVQREATNG